jgi:hypothetical protein
MHVCLQHAIIFTLRLEYISEKKCSRRSFNSVKMPGFENVAQGCCGTGLIELSFLCVLDEPLTCEDTDKYVFFDSAHQTERVYKMEASEMLNTSLAVFL